MPNYDLFGYALAMRVLQSDIYRQLDDRERAECDALIEAGMHGAPSPHPAPEPLLSGEAWLTDEHIDKIKGAGLAGYLDTYNEGFSILCEQAKAAKRLRSRAGESAAPAPAGETGRDGCHDCGRAYGHEHGFPDLVIPNYIWRRISPSGDEGSLLCPSCICKRLHDAGISNVEAAFMSGPIQSVTTPTMYALRKIENMEERLKSTEAKVSTPAAPSVPGLLEERINLLYEFIREHIHGQCKILSQGNGCKCALCNADALRQWATAQHEAAKTWLEHREQLRRDFFSERQRAEAAESEAAMYRERAEHAVADLSAAEAEVARLRERMEGMEKNDARYRWLRDRIYVNPDNYEITIPSSPHEGEDVKARGEAIIDAALAAAKE